MVGKKNSMMTPQKKDIPDLHVMRCLCHSFHSCVSYPCERLPRVVKDLIKVIYNRHCGEPQAGWYVRKVPSSLSQTSWLLLHAAVSRVLKQHAVSPQRILAPSTIHKRLSDPFSKLSLHFIDFILPILNNLSKLMQSKEPQLPKFPEVATTGVKTIVLVRH